MLSALALSCILVLAGRAQERSTCVKCHEKEARAEHATAHAPERVSCVDCHGGDARAADKDVSHGGDSRRKIGRKDIPNLCARCHSDARRMNASGLPIDQHAQYLTSKHGEALIKGNLEAAVCTDCHGTHGIRPARDPLSPTHPLRIASTCGRCHADAGLIKKYGHRQNPETEYRAGFHARLLYDQGDLSAPTCATCHGNHGAAPPGFTDVGRVCGKCHVKQLEHFRASPHAFYAQDGGFKECAACHGNHRIVTRPREILTRCGDCHDPGDAEMKKSEALVSYLQTARSDFEKTRAHLDRLTLAGFHTDDEQVIMEGARTALLQLPPLQHTLDEQKIVEQAAQMRALLGNVDERLEDLETSKRFRKMALLPIWIFLSVLACLLWIRSRQLERNASGGREKP